MPEFGEIFVTFYHFEQVIFYFDINSSKFWGSFSTNFSSIDKIII
jgi:hypothetical protein